MQPEPHDTPAPTPPTDLPPSPRPVLMPGNYCFHCGSSIVPDAQFCSTCGYPPGVTAEQERGYIAYLLRAVDGWVAGNEMSLGAAARLTEKYRRVLGIPSPFAMPPVPPAAPGQPVDFTVIWANALLYVGAFFVVMAALVFLLILEGGPYRTIISSMLAVFFLGSGLISRRFALVRSAGTVLTAIGALLIPLTIIALIAWLQGTASVPGELIWFIASVLCFFLYFAFSLFGFGRFYSLLALVATSSAFLSLFRLFDWEPVWLPAWITLHALVLVVTHNALLPLVRRAFGPLMLAYGLVWTAVAATSVVFLLPQRDDPSQVFWPLAGITVINAIVAWRQGDKLSPVVAGAFLHLSVISAVEWAEGPEWVGAIGVMVFAALQLTFWRVLREQYAAKVQLVVAIIATFAAAAPFIYREWPWAGLAGGLLATALLTIAALLIPRALLLGLPALTAGVAWWYVLKLIPPPEPSLAALGLAYVPLAGFFALLAIGLPLRLSSWRWVLAASAAGYGIGATVLAIGPSGHGLVISSILAVISAAVTARFRRPWLLVAPALWGVIAVITAVDYSHVPRESFGPAVMVLALGFFVAGTLIRAHGGGWSLVARVCAVPFGALAVAFAFVIRISQPQGKFDPGGHLPTLMLAIFGAMIAAEARTSRLLLYPASAVWLAAILTEIQIFELRNAQYFAVPVGIYLGAVAFIANRDRLLGSAAPVLSAMAWCASAMVFCLTSFAQSFGSDGFTYAIVYLVECFAFLILGAVVRSRALLATAVALIVLAGLRLLFENPELMPFVFCFGGFLLLAIGFGALLWLGRRSRSAQPPAPAGPRLEPDSAKTE